MQSITMTCLVVFLFTFSCHVFCCIDLFTPRWCTLLFAIAFFLSFFAWGVLFAWLAIASLQTDNSRVFSLLSKPDFYQQPSASSDSEFSFFSLLLSFCKYIFECPDGTLTKFCASSNFVVWHLCSILSRHLRIKFEDSPWFCSVLP